MMRKAALIIALAVILGPSVTAQFPTTTATYGNIDYWLSSETQEVTAPVAGTTLLNLSFLDEPHHDYEIFERIYRIEVRLHTSALQDSDGVWQFTTALDDLNLTACDFKIPTVAPGGFLEGGLITYMNADTFCNVNFNGDFYTPTTRTVYLNLSVASGTPSDLEFTSAAVRIVREDHYLIPQDANEILETITAMAPLIIFVVLAVWAERKEDWVLYAPAVVAGIAAAVVDEVIPGSRLYIVLATLYLIARAAAQRIYILKEQNRNEN